MNRETYESFQDFCRKVQKQCPYAAFGREEAWEQGVNAIASHVHGRYVLGLDFDPKAQEAFLHRKENTYRGKYKDTYLEGINGCLKQWNTFEERRKF